MKKIATLFAALICGISMSLTQADTRTVITSVSFTGFEGFFQVGMTWNDSTKYYLWSRMRPGEGTGYWWHRTRQALMEWHEESSEWVRLSSEDEGEMLTTGLYAYVMDLRIEGEDGLVYRLSTGKDDEPPLTIVVDGHNWSCMSEVEVGDNYSSVWIINREVHIAETSELDQISDDKGQKASKIIKDNQLLIERGGKVYTLTGQKVL